MTAAFDRKDLEFASHGVTCRGYLYRPTASSGPVPCVVMAHGFAATRECCILPYAEAFAAAGYAAFVFDYRSWGASGGKPRNVLVPSRQVDDYLAAVAFVRTLPGIRADAVAVWGTSFAGGLATMAAARDGKVAAVIGQCPLMDGFGAVTEAIKYAGLWHVMKLSWHATLDIFAALFRMDPHFIPAAGRPGEVAAMTSADSYSGYNALIPEGVDTRVAARVIALLPFHRPVSEARKVACPAFLQICDRETVAPIPAALEAARRMPRAEVKHYDMGHFDIYQGEAREASIKDQLEFLRRHVPVAAKF
ncbi:peptidase S15 [Hyaloraphidium curvatum]|nr:peptidase S15 [Hyaloraphidium curvatum]